MGIPESLKVGPALFFTRKEDYDSQAGGHDPTSDPGTSGEVCPQELEDNWPCTFRIGVRNGKFGKVYYVADDVDDSPEHNGPSCCFVEGDAFIEPNKVVEGGTAKEGDEVPADRNHNQRSVDMQDKSCRACESYKQIRAWGVTRVDETHDN